MSVAVAVAVAVTGTVRGGVAGRGGVTVSTRP